MPPRTQQHRLTCYMAAHTGWVTPAHRLTPMHMCHIRYGHRSVYIPAHRTPPRVKRHACTAYTLLITPPLPCCRGLVLLAFQLGACCVWLVHSLVQGCGPGAGCHLPARCHLPAVLRCLVCWCHHTLPGALLPQNRHSHTHTRVKFWMWMVSTQHRCCAAPHQSAAAFWGSTCGVCGFVCWSGLQS